MPLQITLNVATLRDRLGSFADTYLGTVASGSTAKRINENAFNEALANPVSRRLLLRFAVLYPEVADVLGWRTPAQDICDLRVEDSEAEQEPTRDWVSERLIEGILIDTFGRRARRDSPQVRVSKGAQTISKRRDVKRDLKRHMRAYAASDHA